MRDPPDHPEQAHIDGCMESWFVAILLGGLGSVFSAIGGVFVIWELRRNRSHD